ncbi:MAG TPA: DUF3311 domain-containing protein [Vicinamibacteria bacterium]|jgi:hypothetical protein
MKKTLLGLATLAVYLLHQDFWFWNTARPLVFGFVPIGLFYHAAYCVLASLLLWLLVKYAWPGELEREAERPHEKRRP